ncbi:MAG: DUF362 domain-containing protein, partial [Anaerolineae bacterium]|nr:DUF362 domain-containing protein [Anaerolineae bacterium]
AATLTAVAAAFAPIPIPARVRAQNAEPRAKVALAHAESYDMALIRDRVHTLIDQLGGLADVVSAGDKVAIKTNLTGGSWAANLFSRPSTEIYVTHPAVIRALGEAVLDAGASELYIVESVYDRASWSVWGHAEAAEALGATLIDLNDTRPYDQYTERAVGPDWLIYQYFTVNPLLAEVDVFMSVAKLKCHANAGVTMSMKNLVGMIPMRFYQLSPDHTHRSELHGAHIAYRYRLPAVIVDLVRARPIDFALIDGVMTSEGGEGPWLDSFKPIDEVVGALIAGKNAVATDAVGAAVMGFDPTARSVEEEPFVYCLNHLQMADEYGIGPHDLAEIEVVGETIADLRHAFAPYRPANGEDAAWHIPPGPYGKV